MYAIRSYYDKGGVTYYPMQPKEFSQLQKSFLDINGVSFLGGCCGTTPDHIEALANEVRGIAPKKPCGFV